MTTIGKLDNIIKCICPQYTVHSPVKQLKSQQTLHSRKTYATFFNNIRSLQITFSQKSTFHSEIYQHFYITRENEIIKMKTIDYI